MKMQKQGISRQASALTRAWPIAAISLRSNMGQKRTYTSSNRVPFFVSCGLFLTFYSRRTEGSDDVCLSDSFMSPDIPGNQHHDARRKTPLNKGVKTTIRQCKGTKAKELLFDKLIEGRIRPDSARCPRLRF